MPLPLLRAIGCATPPARAAQAAAGAALAGLLVAEEAGRKARVLARRSQIESRSCVIGTPSEPSELGRRLMDPSAAEPGTADRMSEYALHAPPLAEEACRRAFARDRAAGPRDVTHVLVASCTGFLAPGLDVLLARRLELREDVARLLVGFQGCHAALAALRTARSVAEADPRALVLVACVELCSLHLQRATTDDAILAATLFGDGAAAALVGGHALPPPREQSPLGLAGACTRLVPGTLDGMAWSVGDHGFEMSLSAYVPDLLARDVGPALQGMLDLRDPSSLFWAIHPGGAAILDALQSALRLPKDALGASRAVLARHGNMSSATVLFVLDEILRSGRGGPGVALAFGPGLTIEACRFERAA